ncbi:hypothetical protein P171DRAFT_480042 [Karstenula rhodostoma CBS 690.94]|uniref:Uncharacterized protein n=1 Tax=Karstenula rhodostoma CBS 690.94 TaxID=1392251 RepID=A0A9P4UGE0_9PLEO|nr:hypothetical protein P171DRAFT_480042 [Karstenula rhodostoma CBS 690.94]
MSPLNSTLHLLSAHAADAGTTKHTGIQVQWVPLLVLIVIVILIVIIVVTPKGWMINVYNRIRSAKKQGSATPQPPRRLFFLFSSHSRADDEKCRLKEASHQRPEHDASFIDVHLREIRAFKKPDLQSVQRHESNVLEEVGLPLPVLHRDKRHERVQQCVMSWLKDDKGSRA